MKITDINHARSREEFMALGPNQSDEVHHLKLQGAGVIITLIQRQDEGIDITVNPSLEPYMHNVKVNGELVLNRSQVRIAGVQGSPL